METPTYDARPLLTYPQLLEAEYGLGAIRTLLEAAIAEPEKYRDFPPITSSGAPIVPVAIHGSAKVRNWKRGQFPKVTVQYGDPFRYEKIDDPTREGRTTLRVAGAAVSNDGRRVFVSVENLTPAMQVRVQAGLRSAGGTALPVDYYGTIHRLRPTRH